jgi:hypothetical protein
MTEQQSEILDNFLDKALKLINTLPFERNDKTPFNLFVRESSYRIRQMIGDAENLKKGAQNGN